MGHSSASKKRFLRTSTLGDDDTLAGPASLLRPPAACSYLSSYKYSRVEPPPPVATSPRASRLAGQHPSGRGGQEHPVLFALLRDGLGEVLPTGVETVCLSSTTARKLCATARESPCAAAALRA